MWGRALLVLVALASAGCFRGDVYAPHGPPVRLLSRDEKTSVKRVRRTWYAILGVTRVDEVMPAHLIHNEAIEEVRVRVTDTVPDALIGVANTVLLQVGVLARIPGRGPAERVSTGTVRVLLRTRASHTCVDSGPFPADTLGSG